MRDDTNLFSEEEQAFLRLTEEKEKKYFKEILKLEKENDGYISSKHPKLSINYYIYKYKNEGVSFEDYLNDTENENMLLESEIAVKMANTDTSKMGLRNISKYIDAETQKEAKLSKKRNTRFAIIVLVLVFVLMIIFYLN